MNWPLNVLDFVFVVEVALGTVRAAEAQRVFLASCQHARSEYNLRRGTILVLAVICYSFNSHFGFRLSSQALGGSRRQLRGFVVVVFHGDLIGDLDDDEAVRC